MTQLDTKAIFRRFYEDAWNQGDLALVDELLAPIFFNHEVPDTSSSHKDLYKQAIIETRAVFPDWTNTIDDLIAEEDKVVGRWHSSGTHVDNGRKVELHGLTLVRIVNGQITEFWKKDDSYTVSQQLHSFSDEKK